MTTFKGKKSIIRSLSSRAFIKAEFNGVWVNVNITLCPKNLEQENKTNYFHVEAVFTVEIFLYLIGQ
jgi:hypothetical protein